MMYKTHMSVLKKTNDYMVIASMVLYLIAPTAMLAPQAAVAGHGDEIYVITSTATIYGFEATDNGTAHTETHSDVINIAIDWNEYGLPHPDDGTLYDLDAAT